MYKIYHNPQCSKSREVLEMLEKTEKAVEIVDYQKTGILKSEIRKILELLDVPAMKIIRTKNQDWEIGDAHKKSSQKTLVRFIHEHPRSLQRPIVLKNEREAVIGRPPSNVKELLQNYMGKGRVRHHVNPLADQTEVSFDGFGDDLPIIVDIGADRGEFIEALIEKFGETRNFIVLEIRKPLAQRLREKFAENENVVVYDGDAVRNLEVILTPCVKQGAQIEEIYVNFPDPWFKDKHHKRRVVCQRLIDDVKSWLPAGITWVYQTDQKPLFDDTVELLSQNNISDIEYFDQPPYGYTTKWEDAKVAEGSTINRMKFTLQ